MDAQLAQKLFFQQVDSVLKFEPSDESLLKLLQICQPDLKANDIANEVKRKKAYRQLILLLHPDKHHTGAESAKDLFQRVQDYYYECSHNLMKPTRRRSSSTKQQQSSPSSNQKNNNSEGGGEFPLEFHIQEKWPYLATVQEPITPTSVQEPDLISKSLAYKCINYRGMIAHGKQTESAFTHAQCVDNVSKNVKEVFDKKGGTVVLDSIVEIKRELMERGPVVSASFVLTKNFFQASEHANCFAPSRIGCEHAILIVGWKHSAYGEVWLAKAIHDDEASHKNSPSSSSTPCHDDVPIAMGQFEIENLVLAPFSNFDDIPWMGEEKALEVADLTDTDWYSWSSMFCHLTHSELAHLCMVAGGEFGKAIANKTEFVIREKPKIARSRTGYITDVAWIESKEQWKVTLSFTDDAV